MSWTFSLPLPIKEASASFDVSILCTILLPDVRLWSIPMMMIVPLVNLLRIQAVLAHDEMQMLNTTLVLEDLCPGTHLRNTAFGTSLRTLGAFANTLQTRCKHIADTLQTHCRHVANTLQTRCKHIADTLQTHCRHVANTLQTRCKHIADTLQTHCRHVANTLQTRCKHIADTLQTHCRHVANAFRRIHCSRCSKPRSGPVSEILAHSQPDRKLLGNKLTQNSLLAMLKTSFGTSLKFLAHLVLKGLKGPDEYHRVTLEARSLPGYEVEYKTSYMELLEYQINGLTVSQVSSEPHFKKLSTLSRSTSLSCAICRGSRGIRIRSPVFDATAQSPKEKSDTSVYTHSESDQAVEDGPEDNVNDKRLRGSALIFLRAQSDDTRIPAQNEDGDRQQRDSNKPSQIDVDQVQTPELVQPAKTTFGFVGRHFDVPGSFAVFAGSNTPSVVLDPSERSSE